jgi:hypothetical protein
MVTTFRKKNLLRHGHDAYWYMAREVSQGKTSSKRRHGSCESSYRRTTHVLPAFSSEGRSRQLADGHKLPLWSSQRYVFDGRQHPNAQPPQSHVRTLLSELELDPLQLDLGDLYYQVLIGQVINQRARLTGGGGNFPGPNRLCCWLLKEFTRNKGKGGAPPMCGV